MRLGNAAVVDDCSSQGLPDFYFFSLSPLFFFPSPLSFSRSAFLLCPARPCSRLLVHCLPPHHAGGSAKAAMWWRRRWRKKRLTQRLLFASFVIPLIFLPARRERPPRRAAAFFRRSLSSSAITSLLLLPLPSLFLSRGTHPLARLQLRRPFSPSNSSLFLLRCSASPSSRLSPVRSLPRIPDFDRRSCSSSFYPCCSRVLSSLLLSFFLSFRALLALPVVSNFAKGWRRECAPRPSRGGVFFLPPLPSTLRLVLLLYPLSFFSRSFFFFFFTVPRRSYFSCTRAAVAR